MHKSRRCVCDLSSRRCLFSAARWLIEKIGDLRDAIRDYNIGLCARHKKSQSANMANRQYEILIVCDARHHFAVNSIHISKLTDLFAEAGFARIADYITILLNDKLNDGTGRFLCVR